MSCTILIVAPYLPVPADFGGALRIFHLARELSSTNTVIVLAPATPAEYEATTKLGQICDVATVPAGSTLRQPAGAGKRIAQLRSLTSTESFLERNEYNPRLQAALDRLFLTRQIDLVQFEFLQSALYRLPRPAPTIYDAHNIEFKLLQRLAHSTQTFPRQLFNTLEWRKLRRFERRVWNSVDLVVATSSADSAVIGQATGREVPVVSNGVDLEAFNMGVSSEPGHEIVFTGAMRHQPNADGAIWLTREVMPLIWRTMPDVTLSIVGADPAPEVSALATDSIIVTGRVQDVRPYLKKATISVVPLFSGSGTRLKILEAFAAGVPVISTSIGAEGLDAIHGEHLLIADTPSDFAAGVTLLLNHPAVRERLATNARALVKAQYGWKMIGKRLQDAHNLAFEKFMSGCNA